MTRNPLLDPNQRLIGKVSLGITSEMQKYTEHGRIWTLRGIRYDNKQYNGHFLICSDHPIPADLSEKFTFANTLLMTAILQHFSERGDDREAFKRDILSKFDKSGLMFPGTLLEMREGQATYQHLDLSSTYNPSTEAGLLEQAPWQRMFGWHEPPQKRDLEGLADGTYVPVFRRQHGIFGDRPAWRWVPYTKKTTVNEAEQFIPLVEVNEVHS